MLKKIFNRGCQKKANGEWIPYPGTLDDFLDWLGVDSANRVENLNFAELENLPNIKKYGLIPLGGSHHIGKIQFRWMTTKNKIVEGLNEKEIKYFIGIGKNYNQAALLALIIVWELITRRLMYKT